MSITGWSRRLVTSGALGAASVLVLATGVPAAWGSTSPGFDDQASLFNIFWDCSSGSCSGNGSVSDVSSPSEDGDALDINYGSGNQAYEGLDAYDSASFGTDGDSHADPYQLYVDNAHYYWSNTA